MWKTLARRAVKILRRRQKAPAVAPPREDAFETYKRAHPGSTFAEFYAAQAMQTIRDGKAHSTLGLRLYDKQAGETAERDYFDAGQAAFQRYRRLFDIQKTSRVVDYGCGSLRLGMHFIELLNAGNYMGLDVTKDFIDIGVSASPELIARKNPRLYAINRTSIQSAAEFGADIVFSNAVSYHVHPDETADYLGNLAAICSKPGAHLVFDVKLSDVPMQFRSRGWAYPLELYIETLRPLTFVKQHRVGIVKDRHADGASLKSGVLEFRRD